MKQLLKKFAAIASALALLLALIPTQPARAAFPGLNGRIVFQSNRDGDFEIYTMEPDGSDVRRLTTNAASDSRPAWSPDGKKVIFSSTRDTGSNSQIYVMDADGGNVQRLTTSSGVDDRARYAPSGEKIVFQSTRDHAQPEIYTMDVNGSNVLRLTTNTVQDAEPSYLSETVIIFASRRDGNKEIYSMNQDGSNPTNLTNYASPGNGDDNTPIASLSGDSIFFSTSRDHSITQLYRMDISGANQTKLTSRLASTGAAFMAPEKNMIVFHDSEGGDPEIARMDPDGSGIAVLTSNASSDLSPSIQPLTIPPTILDSSITLNATTGTVTYDAPTNHTDTYESIDPTSVTITTEPTKGTVAVDPNTGLITYTQTQQASTGFNFLAALDNLFFTPAHAQSSNQDSFTYQICSTANSELCTTTTVTVDLAAATERLADTGDNTTLLGIIVLFSVFGPALYLKRRYL